MENNEACGCHAAPKLIFPCSGAADVGELADRTGRRLTKSGIGKMFCLAGIGGKVNNILIQAQSADKILAIDGCKEDCAKNTLIQGELNSFEHIRLSDLGFEKGQSPANEKNIGKVMGKAMQILS